MALHLALGYLNTHEWEVFLEASQAQQEEEPGMSHRWGRGEEEGSFGAGGAVKRN